MELASFYFSMFCSCGEVRLARHVFTFFPEFFFNVFFFVREDLILVRTTYTVHLIWRGN